MASNPEKLRASEKPNQYQELPRSYICSQQNEELDDAQEIVKNRWGLELRNGLFEDQTDSKLAKSWIKVWTQPRFHRGLKQAMSLGQLEK